jgi:hypothetical protein
MYACPTAKYIHASTSRPNNLINRVVHCHHEPRRYRTYYGLESGWLSGMRIICMYGCSSRCSQADLGDSTINNTNTRHTYCMTGLGGGGGHGMEY